MKFLDDIQLQMSTAREFMFAYRLTHESEDGALATLNRIEKHISDQGFEVKRADKDDLWYDYKFRILGMYSSHRPIMKPLSDNQEFKSIKNAIIKEALHLNQDGEKKQYSSKQLSSEKHRVSATAVTRLFKNLCGIFRDKFDDENRRTIYTHAVDKRIRREDEAKRNAEILYD